MTQDNLSRRALLTRGALGIAGLTAASRALGAAERTLSGTDGHSAAHDPASGSTQGRVTHAGIDPMVFLEHFDYGEVSRRASGQTVRDYELTAVDKEIEVAPGVFYPAWTYNGQVPGPTLRCTEGDFVRVHFRNAGSHPHTIHFHGIHPARMDGVYEIVHPGERFVYEFEAKPAGLQLYHCHAMPLKRHIAKGLYGTFLIDHRDARPPAREMVMVMNGFDTNFDSENEVYAVNTVPFAYHHTPIRVQKGELQRIYMVNMTEFDPINSMHLHGNFFNVFRTGSALTPAEFTDTLMFCQGERHVLEFTFDETGPFMFHAHQSEFAELGWMGVFDVVDGGMTA